MGQYPNSALLFKNKKRTKDTQPHYRGNGEVSGEEYNVSLWLCKKSDGEQYLKLAFSKVSQP